MKKILYNLCMYVKDVDRMLPAGNEYNCYRQICISQVGQRAFEWNYLHFNCIGFRSGLCCGVLLTRLEEEELWKGFSTLLGAGGAHLLGAGSFLAPADCRAPGTVWL